MVNEDALFSDLTAAIHSWLQAGRNRSLSALARRTGIAYSTIRRVAQNESAPHPYTALSIADVVMPTSQRIEFLKKHFPTIGNLFDKNNDMTANVSDDYESIRHFLALEPHNLIFIWQLPNKA